MTFWRRPRSTNDSGHNVISQARRIRILDAVDAIEFDYRNFKPSVFVHSALAFRQRSLELLQRRFDPTLHGVFCSTLHTDYIIVNSSLHPLHRAHVLLHEAAHAILGHSSTDSLLTEIPDLLPFLRSQTATSVHMRRLDGSHRNPNEIEAEEFVIEVQRRVAVARQREMFFGPTSSIASARPYTDMLSLRFTSDD